MGTDGGSSRHGREQCRDRKVRTVPLLVTLLTYFVGEMSSTEIPLLQLQLYTKVGKLDSLFPVSSIGVPFRDAWIRRWGSPRYLSNNIYGEVSYISSQHLTRSSRLDGNPLLINLNLLNAVAANSTSKISFDLATSGILDFNFRN